MNPGIDNSATPPRPTPDNTALFRRLRELKRACGRNKHDQATVLIEALLDEGIDTRLPIVRILRHLGFSNDHVILILAEGEGAKRWSRNAEGHYFRPSDEMPASGATPSL